MFFPFCISCTWWSPRSFPTLLILWWKPQASSHLRSRSTLEVCQPCRRGLVSFPPPFIIYKALTVVLLLHFPAGRAAGRLHFSPLVCLQWDLFHSSSHQRLFQYPWWAVSPAPHHIPQGWATSPSPRAPGTEYWDLGVAIFVHRSPSPPPPLRREFSYFPPSF